MAVKRENPGSAGAALPASIKAAWGVGERPAKGPKPGLSLERIVGAAVDVAAAEGIGAVSMSRVAKELGSSAMSLYRYVSAKDELLARFDLADAGRRRVGTYSGGMRRRLDLAASLVGRPSVIFLDEPTTGLDPRSRQGMWDVVTDLVGTGATVFLTTQYLEEADVLADRIAVIDGGRVVAEGTAADLKRRVADQRLDLTMADADAFDAVARLLDGRTLRRDPDELTLGVATDGSAAHVRSLLDAVDPDGGAVAHFAIHTATLDDVFLALTGHAAGTPDEAKEARHV